MGRRRRPSRGHNVGCYLNNASSVTGLGWSIPLSLILSSGSFFCPGSANHVRAPSRYVCCWAANPPGTGREGAFCVLAFIAGGSLRGAGTSCARSPCTSLRTIRSVGSCNRVCNRSCDWSATDSVTDGLASLSRCCDRRISRTLAVRSRCKFLAFQTSLTPSTSTLWCRRPSLHSIQPCKAMALIARHCLRSRPNSARRRISAASPPNAGHSNLGAARISCSLRTIFSRPTETAASNWSREERRLCGVILATEPRKVRLICRRANRGPRIAAD